MASPRIPLPTCVALLLGCASFVAQAQDAEALAKQLSAQVVGNAPYWQ